MRYFFKLDEYNIILDSKMSDSAVTGWTEVTEFNYMVLVNLLNNPDSLVNIARGRPEYEGGRVGVTVPHPANNLLPSPYTRPGTIILAEFGLDGKIKTQNEVDAREVISENEIKFYNL